MQILLVDDEESILESLSSSLTEAGHQVCPCADASLALQTVGDTPIDIVISDIKMPGMDGLELLRRVRAAEPELPVIMITGHGDEDSAIDALQEGAFDYLRKPFRLRALLRSVERADDQRRLTRQLHEEREKLVHAHRLASIGTLAAGIAHEVNNPTTFIKSNIQLLSRCWSTVAPIVARAAEQAPDDRALQFAHTETADLLQGLSDGVQRIERLVKDMSALSRQEKGSSPRLSFDLRACVEEAVRMTKASLPEGTQLVVRRPPEPIPVLADEQQIAQVLMNLVNNAGHGVAQRPEPRVALDTGATGEWGWVRVEDNGAGIPAAIQGRVFDPFFTTKDPGKGTGLGLAVCHGIIADHGGQIGFDSTEGKGTRFWVRLPLATPTRDEES